MFIDNLLCLRSSVDSSDVTSQSDETVYRKDVSLTSVYASTIRYQKLQNFIIIIILEL